MKLVDILARELKVWPEGVSCLSQLQHNGAIINGKGYDGREWARLQIAEDTPPAGVLVTEAEWQAAVDALNAPKVVEWDGVGLPPVDWMSKLSAVTAHGLMEMSGRLERLLRSWRLF